jgi:hypothetical protein
MRDDRARAASLRRRYANASCVDANADAAVEAHGKACFDACPHPLDRATDCYLDCYRNTLMGDASYNMTRVPTEAIVAPWVNAFKEDVPAKGGCPYEAPTSGDAAGTAWTSGRRAF